MPEPVVKVTCPVCHRRDRRVTKAGTIWRHQPWGKNFSGGMVADCKGSGQPARKQQAVPVPEVPAS